MDNIGNYLIALEQAKDAIESEIALLEDVELEQDSSFSPNDLIYLTCQHLLVVYDRLLQE
ncbi:hypothetical protein Sta7437_3161 [Stanieria cyanosphaera PCC 7437]|uniref:Uncharacterized protein n=1 Tax=Stanieria cyanosphaera (strain ATCC 29371 / PCC 7437) TaxID=111780 RepID=K9XTU0_STAC7|nr:hypothetical protein [Stanieria cyanosphaera]AFZ35968.1 hypothetical protein Sta7437_2431 [Stanieria cyanosphaera PCC 7437]AFZ36670.1 hypothetical protein Sta7437_3161 [Stanieria cyanosphaera PCC 7437]